MADPDDRGENEIEDNTMQMLAAFSEDTVPEGVEDDPDENDEAENQASGPDFLETSQDNADAGDGDESAAPMVAQTTAVTKEGSPKGPVEHKDDRLMKVKGLDKQQLCIDLLMVGCVQSFVDFFYITHRKEAPPSENTSLDQQEKKDVNIPEETLIFLKETLESAETARRSKNYQRCFESYNSLAEYFEKVT